MHFEEVKKKLGFGCMRLPMKDDNIDDEVFKRMIDSFIENGFNYFDTAHPYVDERSEPAIKRCLSDRYERNRFLLANKLSANYFKSQADIRPLFMNQLSLCGVDYFDFYLMHSQNSNNYQHFNKCKAYEEAFKLKEEGFIRHVGFSFHDSPELLEEILNDHPEVEFVQLQLNYYDWESDDIQSRKCYEVCVRHNKPVVVMEPVKGGKLANLPKEAREELDKIDQNASSASFALRFAASLDNVFMVLSGMSDEIQMSDNIKTMKDLQPLDDQEYQAIDKIVASIKKIPLIQCTYCKYCTKGCPMNINIPEIFDICNDAQKFPDTDLRLSYKWATRGRGKAMDCIKCGKCESVCPQHLPIRQLLDKDISTYDH